MKRVDIDELCSIVHSKEVEHIISHENQSQKTVSSDNKTYPHTKDAKTYPQFRSSQTQKRIPIGKISLRN